MIFGGTTTTGTGRLGGLAAAGAGGSSVQVVSGSANSHAASVENLPS